MLEKQVNSATVEYDDKILVFKDYNIDITMRSDIDEYMKNSELQLCIKGDLSDFSNEYFSDWYALSEQIKTRKLTVKGYKKDEVTVYKSHLVHALSDEILFNIVGILD